MTLTMTDPIQPDWSPHDEETLETATATDVSARLAGLEVADFDPSWLPFLAAAGAELASVAEISWRFSADDPVVALLRLIAKATIKCPDASGPHTARLLTRLL